MIYSKSSVVKDGSYVHGRSRFERRRFAIGIALAVLRWMPVWLRRLLLAPLFNTETMAGAAARYLFYKSICTGWGNNIYIATKVVFRNLDGIQIGDNVSIHEFCYLDGFGGIEIGDDVSIAHSCSILSFEHDWSGDKPIKYNASIERPVSISDGVWVGCGARVLGGTVLGPRMVVAAGSVVKGSHEGFSIVAGVPAKVVRRID